MARNWRGRHLAAGGYPGRGRRRAPPTHTGQGGPPLVLVARPHIGTSPGRGRRRAPPTHRDRTSLPPAVIAWPQIGTSPGTGPWAVRVPVRDGRGDPRRAG